MTTNLLKPEEIENTLDEKFEDFESDVSDTCIQLNPVVESAEFVYNVSGAVLLIFFYVIER